MPRSPKNTVIQKDSSADNSGTFIVELASSIFGCLRQLTLSENIERARFIRARKAGFVELWVLMWAILAFLIWIIQWNSTDLLKGFIFSLIGWRIFEIVIQQVNVLIFDPYRNADYEVTSLPRLIILGLLNYAEIVFWFATIYLNFSTHFDFAKTDLPWRVLYNSTLMMSGWGSVKPTDAFGFILALINVFVGLFITLIVVSRLVGLLIVPKSKDKHNIP